jgi:hypothetical protein
VGTRGGGWGRVVRAWESMGGFRIFGNGGQRAMEDKLAWGYVGMGVRVGMGGKQDSWEGGVNGHGMASWNCKGGE